MAMYALTEVTKRFTKGRKEVRALDGVDLTVADGDWLAIQGPTGHGKTTLLQLLGALDRPSSGSVLFDGDDLARLSERRLAGVRARSFGFVFQFFNLIPTLTAQENVETALVPLKVSAASRRERAGRALADVGLADRSGHLPAELSGGQQQRVAIARALVTEPAVLLADEPTGNLDEDTRDEIIALLEGLWKDRGLTLITVTHDSTVARRAPRIAWISKGKVSLRKDDRRAARSRAVTTEPKDADSAAVGGAVATAEQSAAPVTTTEPRDAGGTAPGGRVALPEEATAAE
ncbi:ABC transporter ATP-binding protein [Actinocatenispora thailandica]|uniref:ABC transporter ATP-binding protein n=1 Tax=Actinocatenispora thailandica TaxID=227318 RepID=A0A7R7DR06_9ACTN|nr:ABC transporter ATP-binding protein [Actinocatenispora thailandica]BCJ36091.1 ABC transporter ATP-binding protein [Actinocatenispora thailandica]